MKRTYPRKRTTTRQSKYKGNFIRTGRGYTSLSLARPSTLSDRLQVRLDYCDSAIVTALASPVDVIFRANSAFNPSVGGGHQPLGYDQFSALYQFYRVLACGIDVSIINTVSTDAQFALLPNTDATSFTLFTNAAESNRAKHSVWLSGSIGSTILSQSRLKSYVTMRELFGLTGAEMGDLDYAAAVTTSPNRLAYWHVVYATQTGNASFNYTVKLKYYIEYFRRVALGPS